MHHIADSALEFALVWLFVFSAALAVGAYVLYRSVVLRREIATRRVLGARRKDIVRMLLLESAGPIAIGLIAGSLLALLLIGPSPMRLISRSVFVGAIVIGCCGAVGGWLTARYASTIALRESGLFRGAPDKRGES